MSMENSSKFLLIRFDSEKAWGIYSDHYIFDMNYVKSVIGDFIRKYDRTNFNNDAGFIMLWKAEEIRNEYVLDQPRSRIVYGSGEFDKTSDNYFTYMNVKYFIGLKINGVSEEIISEVFATYKKSDDSTISNLYFNLNSESLGSVDPMSETDTHYSILERCALLYVHKRFVFKESDVMRKMQILEMNLEAERKRSETIAGENIVLSTRVNKLMNEVRRNANILGFRLFGFM